MDISMVSPFLTHDVHIVARLSKLKFTFDCQKHQLSPVLQIYPNNCIFFCSYLPPFIFVSVTSSVMPSFNRQQSYRLRLVAAYLKRL